MHNAGLVGVGGFGPTACLHESPPRQRPRTVNCEWSWKMTIEDFPGNAFGPTHTQSNSTEKVDEIRIDIERCPISYADSDDEVSQFAVLPASFSSKERNYEHAALQAWCSLMNAYLEDVSTQRKLQLLKEWQHAEQRLIQEKIPRKISCEELN